MAIQDAPKCGAKIRLSDRRCKAAAMRNGRCRLHGGKTPAGFASPHFKDGRRSKTLIGALLRSQRLRRCCALKTNGQPCRQWAVIGDYLRRCVAHQEITANELFVMRFGKERWFKKRWIKRPKVESSHPAKPPSDEQMKFLSQILNEEQAEEQKEPEEFSLFYFELGDDLAAE